MVDTTYEDIRHWVPQARDLLIGGAAVAPAGEEWDVVNPATEEVIGDPWDPATNIGPMIDAAHRARVEGVVTEATQSGGIRLMEVERPLPAKGYFVNPVLLGGLGRDARAVQQEIFGPVAVMMPFSSTDEAIELANDTSFGLAANVWCNDPELARSMARRIRAGTVWINGGGGMRPDAPFGGYGRSGVGRELGEWGMREYLEVKHIQWRI